MDVHTVAQRHANMVAIKGKNTKPEMVVRRMLHRLGYRYRLHAKSLPGKPDLVFASRKKVIFVHGCFWHMHDCRFGQVVPQTRTGFWQSKRQANAERDLRTASQIAALGWSVCIVWECQLREPHSAQLEVTRFLDHRLE